MKNRLTCAVVKDLLPLYIDKLTSDETNELLEEHLESCQECKELLNKMSNLEISHIDNNEMLEEKAEIDFLKKTKKSYMKKIISSILIVMVIVVCLVVGKLYIIGSEIPADNVETTININGNQLDIQANGAPYMKRINNISFTEKDGVITISYNGVKSKHYHKIFNDTYVANQKITSVMNGDKIIWANGINIDDRTSNAFATSHSYIGNAVENSHTVSALGIADYLGTFTMELQTSKEPYGLKLILTEPMGKDSIDNKRNQMKIFSYALLGLIDNLDVVTFEFDSDNGKEKVEISTNKASKVIGSDVKELSKDVVKLNSVLNKLYQ